MIAVGLLLAVATRLTAAQLVPTPRATLVPASETNRPFLSAASAVAPVDLSAQGYAEDELLVSGQATIHEWAPAGAREAVVARAPRVPYVTRMLVRRPLDTTRFSGRVVVELLDSPERHDVAPLWGLSYEQFLRSGDIWVGLTVSSSAAATLQKFDPIRYQSVGLSYQQDAACKDGLVWDLIAQTGALLRSTSHENPIRDYNVHRVVLAGYGQGGADVVTYSNALHEVQRLGDGEPIYDAYLSAANTSAAPINQCAVVLPAGDPRHAPLPRDVPVVVVLTQTELHGTQRHRADSDEPGDVFRQYEIAGAAHSGPFPAGQPAEVDLRIAGLAPAPQELCRELLSDFPLGLAFNGIWQQFDRLLVGGEKMVSVPRIEVDSRGAPVVDQLGNAQGGWRLPQIEVPLASYSGRSTPKQNDARAVCEQSGSMRRYDAPRLKTLYRDRSGYIERFNAALDQAVEEGRLVKEDAAALKAPAVRVLPAF